MINVDIDLLKKHLNLDLDYTEDDDYIYTLWDVACRTIENHIDQPIDNFVVDGVLDAPLQHAAMLLVGNYYQNRESVTYGAVLQVPHGYEYLLQTYVDYKSPRNESGSV
jgi:uncharacterized phage protein (predicted DNA packaging)